MAKGIELMVLMIFIMCIIYIIYVCVCDEFQHHTGYACAEVGLPADALVPVGIFAMLRLDDRAAFFECIRSFPLLAISSEGIQEAHPHQISAIVCVLGREHHRSNI